MTTVCMASALFHNFTAALKRSAAIERTRTFIGEHRNVIAHFN
jgi:hypothetical protein